jgi:tetratricopeptide (TPR) repeat protein
MPEKKIIVAVVVLAAAVGVGVLGRLRPGPDPARSLRGMETTPWTPPAGMEKSASPSEDEPGRDSPAAALPAPSASITTDPAQDPRVLELRRTAAKAMRRGDPQAAINTLAKALALDPDDDLLLREMSHANAAMGWSRHQAKEYDKAIGFFEEAVHYWDKNEDAARGMAFSLYQNRERELAEQWLLFYMGLGGSRPDAYALLGRILYDQDRLDEALLYFNLSLSLMPEQPLVNEFVAKIHRELKVEEGFFETESSHFTIKYEGVESPGLSPLVMMMCEEAYLKVGPRLGYYPDTPITILLYTREQFQDVTHSPAWAGAIFDGKIRVPGLGLARDDVAQRIIFHEYTHAAVHDLSQGRAPVWLQEGLAQSNEGTSYSVPDLADLIMKNGGPLPLSDLERGFLDLPPQQAKLAYAQSYLAVAYLNDAFGPYTQRELLRRLKEGSDIKTALRDTTNQDAEVFFENFKRWVGTEAGSGF